MIKQTLNHLKSLETIVYWDRSSDFYYESDSFWYVIQNKLMALLIHRLFSEQGIDFPAIPFVNAAAYADPETAAADLFLEYMEKLQEDFFSLLTAVSTFGFSHILLGVDPDDRKESLHAFPFEIQKRIRQTWGMFERDYTYLLLDSVILIPGYGKLFDSVQKMAAEHPIRELFQTSCEILAFSQPCFLGTAGQLYIDSEGGDGYIHLFFFSEDIEFGIRHPFGDYEYFHLGFFYALYCLSLCFSYMKEKEPLEGE